MLYYIFINGISSVWIGEFKLKLVADYTRRHSFFNVDVSNCGDLQQFIYLISKRLRANCMKATHSNSTRGLSSTQEKCHCIKQESLIKVTRDQHLIDRSRHSAE